MDVPRHAAFSRMYLCKQLIKMSVLKFDTDDVTMPFNMLLSSCLLLHLSAFFLMSAITFFAIMFTTTPTCQDKWQNGKKTSLRRYNVKIEAFFLRSKRISRTLKKGSFKAIVVTWKLRRLSRLQVLHAITVCSTLQTSVEAEGSLFSTANGRKTQKAEGRT